MRVLRLMLLVSVIGLFMFSSVTQPITDGEALRGIAKQEHSSSVTTTPVTRDVEFTFSKDFSTSNYVDRADMSDRSASDVEGNIGSFCPAGLQRVTTVDIYYTCITLSITQIHVIEDRDFGAGEVYLEPFLVGAFNPLNMGSSSATLYCQDWLSQLDEEPFNPLNMGSSSATSIIVLSPFFPVR